MLGTVRSMMPQVILVSGFITNWFKRNLPVLLTKFANYFMQYLMICLNITINQILVYSYQICIPAGGLLAWIQTSATIA